MRENRFAFSKTPELDVVLIDFHSVLPSESAKAAPYLRAPGTFPDFDAPSYEENNSCMHTKEIILARRNALRNYRQITHAHLTCSGLPVPRCRRSPGDSPPRSGALPRKPGPAPNAQFIYRQFLIFCQYALRASITFRPPLTGQLLCISSRKPNQRFGRSLTQNMACILTLEKICRWQTFAFASIAERMPIIGKSAHPANLSRYALRHRVCCYQRTICPYCGTER